MNVEHGRISHLLGPFVRRTATLLAFLVVVLAPSLATAQLPRSYVYTANQITSGSVSVVDTATGTVSTTVTSLTNPLLVAVHPNGRYFYVCTIYGDLTRHSLTSPATIDGSVNIGMSGSGSMVLSPDGSRAYVTLNSANEIQVIDLDAMTIVDTIAVNSPRYFAVSPDGAMLYVTATGPARLDKINLSDHSVVDTEPIPGTPSGIALSPDGANAYVAVAPNLLVRYSTVDLSFVSQLALGGSPGTVAMTPDGSFAVVVTNAETINLIQVPAMTYVDVSSVSGGIWGVPISPRGDRLYAGSGAFGELAVLTLSGGLLAPEAVISVGTNPATLSTNISPAILTAADGVLDAGGDASLSTAGFASHLPLWEGTLRFTADATVTKRLSLLGNVISGIDTNGSNVTLGSDSSGDLGSSLKKSGAGTLTLAANHTNHASQVVEGTLLVNGTHPEWLDANGANATVGGSGTIGDLTITSGSLAPGATGTGAGVLTANSLIMGASSTLRIALDSATPGAYGRVDVTGVGFLGNATLAVTTGFSPVLGTVFTILTNGDGAFAGLPQDGIFMSGAVSYRISYTGGDSNDVTLTVINQMPTLTAIQDQTLDEDDAQISLPFTIGDPDDLPTSLVTTATSSNTTLFPNGSISVTGTNTARTLLLTPAPNQHGTATITVRVTDSVQFFERTFDVTVNGVNDPPTVDAIAQQTIAQDTPLAPVAFGVADVDTDVNDLTVTLTSSNQTLVPDANLAAGGTGATRTVAATPAAGQFGSTVIAVGVSDGHDTTYRQFTLIVTEEPEPPSPAGLTYALAEGATGSFFDTDILLANPNMVAVPVTVTFLKPDGTSVVESRELAALSRTTIAADGVAGLEATTFSVLVKTGISLPIAVERTMRWDASGYGASTEKASMGEATTWLFAEGAQGWFSTFLLLANPQETPNVAHVTWLREGEAPVTRDYPLAAASRTTIDAGADTELQGRSFGARVTFDQPGMAERAMYFGANPIWMGGHAASGANAPATTWYLAEGATGSFFTTYVLIANPGTKMAEVTLTYYTDAGEQVTLTEPLAAGQRMTRNVALDSPVLANTAFGTKITATQPVVVERAQYWGLPAWIESHNSAGVTQPFRRWALAEGRAGGDDSAQTYILLGNFGTETVTVTLTFLRENNAMPVVKTVDVPAGTRVTVGVTGDPNGLVPELTGERFGTLIESTGNIVVERSLYTNASGIIWAAGTNATGTPIVH